MSIDRCCQEARETKYGDLSGMLNGLALILWILVRRSLQQDDDGNSRSRAKRIGSSGVCAECQELSWSR